MKPKIPQMIKDPVMKIKTKTGRGLERYRELFKSITRLARPVDKPPENKE